MTLSLYIARRFLTTLALMLVIFFGLLFLLNLIEEVRRTGVFSAALTLALLHTPKALYHILPLVVVLSAIALFLRLARTSELVAIRAAGRSALRILVAPVLAAFAFGLVAVAVLDPLAAATEKRYSVLAARFGHGQAADASFASDGLWLRQGDADSQWVIHAARANPDGTALYDLSFLAFSATGGPKLRIEAASADLSHGQWLANDAKEWSFAAGTNPEAAAVHYDRLALTTDLTAAQIRDSFGTPDTVGIWDLPAYIADLNRAGFSSRRHAVWFQMELALPVLLSAMVLVGAGFTMRHARFGGTGMLVMLALGAGIAVFFVRNFAQILGETGQIPIILAAWSPPLATLMLSISLLLHLEDG